MTPSNQVTLTGPKGGQITMHIILSLCVPSPTQTSVSTPPAPSPEIPAEEKKKEEPVKPRSLLRRKSDLPADFDTAMALKHYNTVDKVLKPSKEM